jgi:hypothetical protein
VITLASDGELQRWYIKGDFLTQDMRKEFMKVSAPKQKSSMPVVRIDGDVLSHDDLKSLRPNVLVRMTYSAVYKYHHLIRKNCHGSGQSVVFALDSSDALKRKEGADFALAVKCDKAFKRLAEPCDLFLLPWRVEDTRKPMAHRYRLELVVDIRPMNRERIIPATMHRFVSTDQDTGKNIDIDADITTERMGEVRSRCVHLGSSVDGAC